jgi:Flp pilus assembly protein TadB
MCMHSQAYRKPRHFAFASENNGTRSKLSRFFYLVLGSGFMSVELMLAVVLVLGIRHKFLITSIFNPIILMPDLKFRRSSKFQNLTLMASIQRQV